MKKVFVGLVEGENDRVFLERLLNTLMHGTRIGYTRLGSLFGYMHVLALDENDRAVLAEYASEGGFEKAVRIATRLCIHILRSRELARKASYTILVLVDGDHAGKAKLGKARSIVDMELSSTPLTRGIVVNLDSYGWAMSYRMHYQRTSGDVVLVVSVVECSLECQVAKHVLSMYSVFCRGDECHRALKSVKRDERFENIRRLIDELESGSGDEWYRDLKRVLKARISGQAIN